MVSIIIPAYNSEAFLRECLESVTSCVGGSETECEIIVVNDGSTDSTALIAAEFSGINLISRANGGLSAARNTGIDAARGEWLMFVDSDDCLMPGAVDRMLGLAESTHCRIAAGACIKGTEFKPVPEITVENSQVLSAPTAIEQTLYQQTPLLGAAWGKLWHRSIFDTERFSEGLYFEDLDFFYRAFLAAGAVAVSDIPVYFYRQHPASFLHRFSAHSTDVLEVTDRMERILGESYPSLLPAVLDRRFSANFNIYNRILALGTPADPTLRQVADSCWKQIRRLRVRSLFNMRVRALNKTGALASLPGRHIYNCAFRLINNHRKK